MTTDWNVSLPGGENTRFMLKEETHRIIGCAFEVSKELGHGLHEKFERVVSQEPKPQMDTDGHRYSGVSRRADKSVSWKASFTSFKAKTGRPGPS